MIHYLVIGHADFDVFEQQYWRYMMFNGEQPDKFLYKRFIRAIHDDIPETIGKEIHVDFIIGSKSSMVVNDRIIRANQLCKEVK